MHDAPQRQTRRTARAFTATTLVVLAASLLATVPAHAAPGDLDASFSGDGKQTTDFGDSDHGQAVAIQADGKIVVAGGSGANFALARYSADGSLDTAFSGDGKVTTEPGASFYARSVAIQADGKIAVAGGSGTDLALARYRADGSLDTAFSGGTVTTDLGGSDYAQSLAIQADGRIVVAGSSGADFALARYRADGSLDTSFSGDGKVTTDLGGSDQAQTVAIAGGGQIVVAGGSDGDKFALARYRADGSLDTSLSGDGTVTTPLGGHTADAAAIRFDGSIVVAGARHVVPTGEYELPQDDLALARYTADGALDTSFGTGGRQTTDFGFGYAANDAGVAVAIQADGKIVVAGWTSLVDWALGSGRDFALARYTPNGSPDTSFGAGGAVDQQLLRRLLRRRRLHSGDRDSARRQDRGGGRYDGRGLDKRLCARPLPGRIGILGHGTHELKPAHDLGYRHRGSSADGQLGGLDGEHPDQPQLPVASVRLDRSQLR